MKHQEEGDTDSKWCTRTMRKTFLKRMEELEIEGRT